jgi:hypothetical protein
MSANPLPPADSPAERRADREFRAFFRTQLPDPFPPFVPPAAAEPVRARRRTLLTRSRLVLAVCVALVLGALVSLTNPIADRPTPVKADGAAAEKTKDGLNRPLKSPRPK